MAALIVFIWDLLYCFFFIYKRNSNTSSVTKLSVLGPNSTAIRGQY